MPGKWALPRKPQPPVRLLVCAEQVWVEADVGVSGWMGGWNRLMGRSVGESVGGQVLECRVCQRFTMVIRADTASGQWIGLGGEWAVADWVVGG